MLSAAGQFVSPLATVVVKAVRSMTTAIGIRQQECVSVKRGTRLVSGAIQTLCASLVCCAPMKSIYS